MASADGVNISVEPNSDDGMQADVDAHAAAMDAHVRQQQAAAQQQQQPQPTDTMVQQMMQAIMQKIMEQVSNAFAQNGGQSAGVPQGPGSSGVPTGPTPWQMDSKMANVRLDIKASVGSTNSPTRRMSGPNGELRSLRRSENAIRPSQTK